MADADRGYIRSNKLHRVVDGHAGGDRTAWRVDVDVDVFFRIFGFEKEKLRHDQVGNLIVDRGAEKNNIVFQESRVNIEGALTARRLLDDHWYEGHRISITFLNRLRQKDEG